MVKKIKISDLIIGMYVVDINRYWPNHPFRKNNFRIENANDIQRFINGGLTSLYVDQAKEAHISFDPELTKNNIDLYSFGNCECHNAKRLFLEAKNLFLDIINDVKKGDLIDLNKIASLLIKIYDSLKKNPNALLTLSRVRNKNKYTIEHSVSVAVLLMTFAKHLKMPISIIIELGIGGFLHDIGKIKTPISILEKKGKLDEDEALIIRRHVIDGFSLISKIKGISQVSLDVVMQHHERMDGSGYPRGLKGDEISQYGQMAAIIDVYDAMASMRSYNKSKEPTLVLRLLHKWSHIDFDSVLVQKFIQTIGIYPPGSLLLLSNNYLAKVMSVGDKLLQPTVKMFMDITTKIHIDPIIIDLSTQDKLTIKSFESFEKWDLTW